MMINPKASDFASAPTRVAWFLYESPRPSIYIHSKINLRELFLCKSGLSSLYIFFPSKCEL